MKKILQVCAVDFTVEHLLLPLVNRLKHEGYEVDICCTSGQASKKLEGLGYNFEYVEIDRKIQPFSNLKSVINLYKVMKKNHYDVVHVHTPVAGVLARIAAKLAKVPIVIYTAHGFYFHDNMSSLNYKLFTFVEKTMGRHFTDYIFTQSEEDKRTAEKLNIIDNDKLLCISNGVDINKFNSDNVEIDIDEYKKELGIPVNSNIISFTGRLVKEKGIIDLFEAFKKLSLKYKNLYLVVIGNTITGDRDLETKEKIQLYFHDKELSSRIKCLGLRKDIPQLLKMSDIFILPSYREGMPRSIIEAMAMGKPIITTNIRGCREEVINEKNGFIVEVNNGQQIFESVCRLLDDAELYNRFSSESRKRVEEFFDEEKVLDKQINIIEKFINDN